MKKRLYVLSVVSLLGLVACGGSTSSGSTSTSGTTSEGSTSTSGTTSEGSTSTGVTTSEDSSSSSTSVEPLFRVSIETEHLTASLVGSKDEFAAGDEVVISVIDVELDYTFDRLEITDASSNPITYTEVNGESLKFSFEMPASNVTVRAIAELTTYEVKLPEELPDGISIETTNEPVLPGATVSLLVKNTVKTSKRIDAVKLNGEALDGSRTNVSDTTLFTFVMGKQDAVITLDIVDVYVVSVASNCEEAFTLEGNVVAAAGEVVEFTPVFFPGSWAKSFVAVEEDVEIVPSTTKPGAYTFVMPAHGVTITAEVGVQSYQVLVDVASPYFAFDFAEGFAKEAFKPGDEVKFKVTKKGVDADVLGVKANGVELVALPEDENGDVFYSVTMPKGNLRIEPILNFNYKSFEVSIPTDTDVHFSYELKTTVNDEIVDAENHVLSNQQVIISYTELAGEDNSFLPGTIEVYGGDDAETATTKLSNAINNYDGTFTFTTSAYMYYKIVPTEAEFALKGNAIVGKYEGGFRYYFGTNTVGSVDYSGSASLYTSGTLTAYEGKEGVYSLVSGKDVFFDTEHQDRLLVINYSNKTVDGEQVKVYSDSGSFLFVKNKGIVQCTDRTDGTFTIAVKDEANTTLKGIFYSVKFTNDESPVMLYIDVETGEVDWNASISFGSSMDASTIANGDKAFIKDGEGNIIKAVAFTTINTSKADGFRHYAKTILASDLQGTFTSGDQEIILDGFNTITIGEDSFEYEEVAGHEGMIKYTNGETVVYLELNKEDHTFTTSRGPSDGIEGTYTAGETTFVLDGYGGCTSGEAIFTYTILSDTYISISDGTTETIYVIDKVSFTLTEFSGDFNEYVNTVYRGTFYEESWEGYVYYEATLTFIDATTCHMLITYGGSAYTPDENTSIDLDGTYSIAEDGTVTVVIPFNSRNYNFVFTDDNGVLVLSEEVVINYAPVPANTRFTKLSQ